MSVHSHLGNSHVVIDGQFVSTKVSQVVEAINDRYGSEVQVKWVPPGARSEGQAAFAIEHHPPGGHPYVIFYVKTEDEFDIRVLHKLIFNDQRNGRVQMSELEAFDLAQKALQRQEFLDSMEEAADIARHILKTPKNTYKVSEDLVIREGVPFNTADWGRRKHL